MDHSGLREGPGTRLDAQREGDADPPDIVIGRQPVLAFLVDHMYACVGQGGRGLKPATTTRDYGFHGRADGWPELGGEGSARLLAD